MRDRFKIFRIGLLEISAVSFLFVCSHSDVSI